ncbi:hypothetical protein Tco_0654487 [Tanacetum coccineum]|uniref:No apical meristem-associated C-terminal domain-containing protein n=1 Tax=Tanacetum coccineum TaxID=301880 RepID=A0ABQ4X3R0_9ASTR
MRELGCYGKHVSGGLIVTRIKISTFAQEDAWEILRKHAKWDAPAPAPVDLTEDEEIVEVNTDELFGPDARPRLPGKQRPGKKTKSDTSVSTGGSSSSSQFGDIMTKELRLKREAAEAAFEVAKEKDRTVMRLEEMKFLAISTKDLLWRCVNYLLPNFTKVQAASPKRNCCRNSMLPGTEQSAMKFHSHCIRALWQ